MTLRNRMFGLIHLTRTGCWILSGAGPPIVSSGSDNDNATCNGNIWTKDPNLDPVRGPRPHETYQLAYVQKRGRCRPGSPTEPDISRVRDSAASVSARPPTEPDLQSDPSVRSPEDTNPNYCTKNTTCSNLTASSRTTGYQSTPPSKRLGVREGETSIQSDQVSEMGEITVGIQFSQQQGSGRANGRGRSSNVVDNDHNPWGLRQ